MHVDLSFAQFTDCHLLADKQACHHGAPVYQNLVGVLKEIKQNPQVNFAVFTGDLTQDHSDESYQNFVEAIAESQITIPVYWLAGNHDDRVLLNNFLSEAPFNNAKQIEAKYWQVLLLDSKSETPAGELTKEQFNALHQTINPKKFQMLMMHHHAVDVGYFIDHHGLNNQNDFWQHINLYPSIKAIACGHVHNALMKKHKNSVYQVPVITCPATSIQFDQTASSVVSAGLPAGYRIHQLCSTGEVRSVYHFLAN
ncbi:metallophosphoesterase [Thalassotalea profundi]|uniref:3',5'-cyclic adenosine monophosphate phosphodiesterase CpdA n=1 Tax=Thalassotalea profundi TaxID=2036687 RepID=A0ABQ3IH35_9GAMM|nr:metallophosphoesterase [Thalassotalea profundi]GHE84307.1 3',5'-cyclic adenosine monophosphate phosphodiesterase CpdA [Thalassotalea profundi]